MEVEKFISAIEKRPALYNTRLKEYADKKLRKTLWLEVCEEFVENWRELGDKEKTEKGNDLQKKWKNLRTCFKREYDTQTNGPSGSGEKKRRKYLYFDHLLFLKDSVESRNTSSSHDQVNIHLEEIDNEDSEAGPSTVFPAGNTNYTPRPTSKRKKSAISSFEESLLQILRQKKDEDKEIDEDKFFLLSLLPAFKKFNEEQKFYARTEILRVMRQVRLSGSQYNVQAPHQATHTHTQTQNAYQQGTPEISAARLFSRFSPGRPNEEVVSPASTSNQDTWENASDVSST